MNIEDYLTGMNKQFGGLCCVALGSAEDLEGDVIKRLYSRDRVIEIPKLIQYVRERTKKVRSYPYERYPGAPPSQVVVYSHDPKREPKARFTPGKNMRTLWHGCSVSEFISILADGGYLRHTTSSTSLLGNSGAYVGTFKKAINYIGSETPTGVNSYFGYTPNHGGPPLLEGVMLRMRVDLGRIKVGGSLDLYQNVKHERDTICAYRGTTAGGRTWNKSGLRESEWVVNKDQAVIDEIHLVCNRRAIEYMHDANEKASGRKAKVVATYVLERK